MSYATQAFGSWLILNLVFGGVLVAVGVHVTRFAYVGIPLLSVLTLFVEAEAMTRKTIEDEAAGSSETGEGDANPAEGGLDAA